MLKVDKKDDGSCQLTLDGEATIYTAAQLKGEMAAPVADCRDVTLDLSGVSEIDTACFQLLIQAKREFEESGRSWRMTGHSPAVLEVLDLLGMESFFGDPMILPPEA